MKLKKGMEQATCVLIILALEKDQKPVKSSDLSKQLDASDSYLKKIMRKLVVEGIVKSDASRDGGFRLAKPLNEITMLDVYYAIEGHGDFLEISHLPEKIFTIEEKIQKAESEITEVFQEGQALFLQTLANYPLSKIFGDGDYREIAANWKPIERKLVK